MYASGIALVSRVLRSSGIYFTWQARDILLCKGHDRRLWRPSSVPLVSRGLRIFGIILLGRCVSFCSARGVMWISGIPLACRELCISVLYSGVPWLRGFCVAGVRLSALQGA